MAKKGNLKIQRVNQTQLHEIASLKGSIRGGGTINPTSRAGAYQREGYGGTMYVAETQNMKQAENQLLQDFDFRHNEQERSNLPKDPGFTYVIQGKKFED